MPNCELCGEPMAEGEEMFKYHGSLGPCPKPPLPKPTIEAVVEYRHWKSGDDFVLGISANGEPYAEMKFETEGERQRAHDDLLGMMRKLGAKDLPGMRQ